MDGAELNVVGKGEDCVGLADLGAMPLDGGMGRDEPAANATVDNRKHKNKRHAVKRSG